ncbi:DUF3800 domain-containing protein [Saccharopolyspora griseoalba]|uniref:DUF3800 domain-containing protein n=1 Tax=Saccharopolyspora griseoalba TaxID=1431848 RepID=A0ABW2LUP5_9PSEU
MAFVDESFRVGEPGRTFYVMAAALFERHEITARRDSLAQVTAGRVVHATDWFRAGQHDGLQHVLGWARDNVAWHYLTVEAPVPSGQSAHKARTACLQTLLVMLAETKAHSIVLDTRGRTTLDAQDETVARELRRSGDIARHTALRHIDDRHELLLGCADLVAWSARRRLANDDNRWWPHLAPVTTLVEAGTRSELDLNDP